MIKNNKVYQKELSFSGLSVCVTGIGDDYHLTLCGGEKPHIGCTVLAQPRQSLKGDGCISATSSVLNIVGHKDETICRYLAEEVAKAKEAVTVCTGGFHIDDITEEQIKEVMAAVRELAGEIIAGL